MSFRCNKCGRIYKSKKPKECEICKNTKFSENCCLNKKYLTEDEAENLKEACKDEDEQAVIRDMLDTGMTLKEALEKRKYWKNLKT